MHALVHDVDGFSGGQGALFQTLFYLRRQG
jgi:hypothetical protein